MISPHHSHPTNGPSDSDVESAQEIQTEESVLRIFFEDGNFHIGIISHNQLHWNMPTSLFYPKFLR